MTRAERKQQEEAWAESENEQIASVARADIRLGYIALFFALAALLAYGFIASRGTMLHDLAAPSNEARWMSGGLLALLLVLQWFTIRPLRRHTGRGMGASAALLISFFFPPMALVAVMYFWTPSFRESVIRGEYGKIQHVYKAVTLVNGETRPLTTYLLVIVPVYTAIAWMVFAPLKDVFFR